MSDALVVAEPMQIELFGRAVAIPDCDVASTCDDIPLTFTESCMHVMPDFEWRPRPGVVWQPGQEAGTAPELHAEQSFEYHRAVRPGETLRVTRRAGRIWTKPGRSGLLQFAETITDFTDGDDRIVVTSTSVGVRVLGSVE
jgi:hypothetical protein